MQAAIKVNQPGTIARQIVWRGENTTAGVIDEPGGLKPKPHKQAFKPQGQVDAAHERMAQPKYPMIPFCEDDFGNAVPVDGFTHDIDDQPIWSPDLTPAYELVIPACHRGERT
jgi:hypothetical protein